MPRGRDIGRALCVTKWATVAAASAARIPGAVCAVTHATRATISHRGPSARRAGADARVRAAVASSEGMRAVAEAPEAPAASDAATRLFSRQARISRRARGRAGAPLSRGVREMRASAMSQCKEARGWRPAGSEARKLWSNVSRTLQYSGPSSHSLRTRSSADAVTEGASEGSRDGPDETSDGCDWRLRRKNGRSASKVAREGSAQSASTAAWTMSWKASGRLKRAADSGSSDEGLELVPWVRLERTARSAKARHSEGRAMALALPKQPATRARASCVGREPREAQDTRRHPNRSQTSWWLHWIDKGTMKGHEVIRTIREVERSQKSLLFAF